MLRNSYGFLSFVGTLTLLLSLVCSASAQQLGRFAVAPQSGVEPREPGDVPPSPEDLQDDETETRESYGIGVSIGPDGAQRIVSGYWTSLRVSGSNRTDEETEETVVAWIGGEDDLQSARKFWIPSGAQRVTWLPIQVPEDLTGDIVTVPLKSIHLNESDGREAYRKNFVGMATSERSLLLSWEESRTAVMMIPEKQNPTTEQEVLELIDMIYAGRDTVTSGTQDLGLSQLGDTFLPPSSKGLDPFDQIIIGDDRFLQDSSASERIRGWLHDGGRLWIMVDRLPYESIVQLLGDRVPFTVVDRTELNAFEHFSAPPYSGADPAVSSWESERPAALVRVLADVEDVQSTIQGWPTAFWMPVGKGEILFTTLSHDGWVQNEGPTTTYSAIAKRFFVPRLRSIPQSTKLVPLLQQEIGYRIPRRLVVASVLGIHMLIVLISGIWLHRQRSLQRLAIVVPLASIIAAGVLVLVANQRTSSVPSTIAVGQLIRANANSTQARVDEIAAVYSQQERELAIESSPNATTELVEESDGELRRVVWTDSGRSQWQFVTQPPGAIRHVASEAMVTLAQPWSVEGTFDIEGFRGNLNGIDAEKVEDGIVIAHGSPPMAVELDRQSNQASLVIQPEDILPPDQYIDAALMSDVQQARQTILRQLLDPSSSLIGREPSLLVWTEPVASGVTFSEDFEKRGTALASIPVSIRRPPNGSSFTIPAGFVPLRSYAGDRGISTIYNQQTGRWLEDLTKAATIDLRSLPPASLLPFELKRATVQIKVNAPGRRLTLSGFQEGSFVPLDSEVSPNGVVTFVVDDASMLSLDSQGGWRFSLAISTSEEETRVAELRKAEREKLDATEGPGPDEASEIQSIEINEDRWRIEYVHVRLQGTTL